MRMFFNGLQFRLIEKSIGLTEFCGFTRCENDNGDSADIFADKTAFCSAQSFCGSIEGKKLKYLSYAQSGALLEVVQANNLISVSTGVKADKLGALKISNVINNVYSYPVTLGDITVLTVGGFSLKNTYICCANDLSLLKNSDFALETLIGLYKKVTPETLSLHLEKLGLPSDNKWVFYDQNARLYLAFCYEDLKGGWEFFLNENEICFISDGKLKGDGEIMLNPNGGEYVSRTLVVAVDTSAEEAVNKLNAVFC